MNYLLIACLWTGYCALHSYLISNGFTVLLARRLKRYYAFYRLFYVVLSFVLLIPLIQYTEHADHAVPITYPTPINTVRYLLLVGSLVTFAWAFFFNYDWLSFFGIRQILAFRETDKPSQGITRKGLLGVVRHPMYFALIVYLWCQIFSLMDLMIAALLTLYVLLGTILEEKKLVLEFGDSYTAYQQQVPMLIPFAKRATAAR
jgi:methanethiol S-methyltransferase